MRSIKIIDATLREGNQAPGVTFSPPAAATIAKLLQRVGVDIIECGHAAISESERERIRAVVAMDLGAPLLGHARATIGDVDQTADLGVAWVGIFAGINSISRESRLISHSEGEVTDKVMRAIGRAKQRGLKVRFTVEDASRTKSDTILRLLSHAVGEGADRICFADTVGILTPFEVHERVASLREACPGVEIETHFHDDRGLAIANSLSAVKAGANWVSTSTNGLGERCGITDLSALIGNLVAEGESANRFDMEALQELSRYVGAISRSRPDDRRPVVGRNAFTHTSRLHALAAARNREAYEWCAPERLARETTFASPALLWKDQRLVNKPKIICASELPYHRSGPGVRHVFVDDRFIDDARQYCVIRDIPEQTERAPRHVDAHRHAVDSLWMFIGRNEDLTGLRVEIDLDGSVRQIDSPVAVHVPAGMLHSYAVVSGSGYYINHVQAGSYHESLLYTEDFLAQESLDYIAPRCKNRLPDYSEFRAVVAPFVSAKLATGHEEIHDDDEFLSRGEIDSVSVIELFFFIEDTWGRGLMPTSFDPANIGSLNKLYRQIKENYVQAHELEMRN